MIDPNLFDEVVKKLSATLPPTIRDLQEDLEHNLKSILQSTFAKLDLVSREEFDVQAGVLAKTRAKLESLELRVAAIENDVAS